MTCCDSGKRQHVPEVQQCIKLEKTKIHCRFSNSVSEVLLPAKVNCAVDH